VSTSSERAAAFIVDAIEFFRAGVDVDQFLLRTRRLQQRVAAGGHLAQPRADRQHQVGLLDACRQLGVQSDADVAGIERVEVVEGVLEAEGVAHRQPPVLGKPLQRLRRLHRPAAAAGDHERFARRQQQLAQPAQRARVAPGFRGLDPRQRPRRDHLRQHVLRQHQHHRAGPAVHRGGEGAHHVFRDPLGVVDAFHPLGHAAGAGAEEAAVVQLLEGFAVALVGRHVADEQHHRRGILERGVHADRCIGGARSAGDEAHARPAGQLAVGLGHVGGAALLPVDHEADLVAVLVEAVERGQVALTRHTEGVGHALRHQAFDKEVTGDLVLRCAHGLGFVHWMVSDETMTRDTTPVTEKRQHDADRSQGTILAAARDGFPGYGRSGVRRKTVVQVVSSRSRAG
jgi:hypothetical protein